MKMPKSKLLIISFLIFILGFVLNGLAWTVLPGPELNTISLIVGFILMFFGLIMFVISFFRK